MQGLVRGTFLGIHMKVLGSNLLSGDPKSGYELLVGCRPTQHGGSFLLIDFWDPTVGFFRLEWLVSALSIESQKFDVVRSWRDWYQCSGNGQVWGKSGLRLKSWIFSKFCSWPQTGDLIPRPSCVLLATRCCLAQTGRANESLLAAVVDKFLNLEMKHKEFLAALPAPKTTKGGYSER